MVAAAAAASAATIYRDQSTEGSSPSSQLLVAVKTMRAIALGFLSIYLRTYVLSSSSSSSSSSSICYWPWNDAAALMLYLRTSK